MCGVMPSMSSPWFESRSRLEITTTRMTVCTSILFFSFFSIFDRYLNRLFIAIDANFRLKRRDVSSEEADPSFSNSWSYFVPEQQYKAYLQEFSDLIIQEVNPVSLLRPNTSSKPEIPSQVHVQSIMQSMRDNLQRA